MAIFTAKQLLEKHGVKPEQVTSGGATSPQFVSTTTALKNAQPTQPQDGGVLSRVGNVISTAGQNVQEAISGQGQYAGQSPITRGFEAAGSAAMAIPQTIAAVAPEPIREAGAFVGEQVGKGFDVLTYKIASTKLFSDIGKLEAQGFINPQDNPEFYRLKEQLQVAKSSGDVASSILSAQGTATTLQKGVDITGKIASKTGEKASLVANTADEAFTQAKDLRKTIQTAVGKKTVSPQLQASTERLMGKDVIDLPSGKKPPLRLTETAERLSDPVATYDDYLQQSQKALTDIYADPAISKVGSEIGDAFTRVVKVRKAVGAKMGSELKTVGKLRVPVTTSREKLLSELKDSGLAYNPKTKQLTSFTGSKFAPEEVTMLDDFVKELNKLGDTPRISDVDNLLSRTTSKLKFAKGKAGVIGTTNAERIINGGLEGLRQSLNPKNNGVKALEKYWAARKSYSDLSDFIKEGEGYLGKVTQTGDFAKDASLAKSSVQSILNNGKKDWLFRLEGLTGYQALDKSILALQAMKDAGDFRGLSLLETLSEGAIPTSKAGFTQAALDYVLQKGANIVAGSPEAQTRAFLTSLKEASKKASQEVPPTQ